MEKGVYFLSSNNVFDLTVAFLNSFRKFNPDIALCFIPYSDDHDKILATKEFYKFQVFENLALLRNCDEISIQFHKNVNGTYRKLAMWDGVYEEFVYIDIDTIVLNNIEFAFNYLAEYPCLTSHSNMPSIRNSVWKDSIFIGNRLNQNQIEFAANTGFITSKKGFICMEWMQNQLKNALMLKEHMELNCHEQPLLNYFIVTSGKPFSSLFILYYYLKKDEKILLEGWAGIKGHKIKDGKLQNNKRIFLLHWATLWQPRGFDFKWFRFLKLIGIIDKKAKPKLYAFMPYKKLWNFYRKMSH